VEHGADINIETYEGETPLFYAWLSGNDSIIE